MRKMLGSLAAVGVLTLMGLFAGPAAASGLQAGYDNNNVVVDINLPDDILYGGETVQVKVAATQAGQPLVCNTLTVSAAPDLVESFSGGGQSSFVIDMDTEVVSERTPTQVTATCGYTPVQSQGQSPASGSASRPLLSASCGDGCVTNSATVTLLPRDADTAAGGVLPTTGTELGLWLLVAGGVLIVGGGAVALVSRRRHH